MKSLILSSFAILTFSGLGIDANPTPLPIQLYTEEIPTKQIQTIFKVFDNSNYFREFQVFFTMERKVWKIKYVPENGINLKPIPIPKKAVFQHLDIYVHDLEAATRRLFHYTTVNGYELAGAYCFDISAATTISSTTTESQNVPCPTNPTEMGLVQMRDRQKPSVDAYNLILAQNKILEKDEIIEYAFYKV